MQCSINEVEDHCLNVRLVYRAALVSMGSMLTGDTKVSKHSEKTKQHLSHLAWFESNINKTFRCRRVTADVLLYLSPPIVRLHAQAVA